MSVKLEVLTSIASCDSLLPQWEELLNSCPNATVFDSPAWIKANLSTFQSTDTWILAFHSSSVLAAMIPLVARRGRRYFRECRWMEFAGLPFADYGSCLVRPSCEASVAEGFLAFCRSQADRWDGIYLDRQASDSPFVTQLALAGRNQGLHTTVRESARIRQLAKQEYMAERQEGSHASKSLRKSRNRLSEQGEIGFVVYDRVDSICERLQTFFLWHTERFTAKGMRSPLADPEHQAFYRHIVEELAPEGKIWLSCLTCGQRLVAMRFSPVFRGTLHLYSTCFSAEFAKYSPSMLHLEMLLEHAFRSGIECVDFGIGESPQKEFAKAGSSRSLAALEIYRDGLSELEGRFYRAAERSRSQSAIVARAGKLFRRIFPYNVR